MVSFYSPEKNISSFFLGIRHPRQEDQPCSSKSGQKEPEQQHPQDFVLPLPRKLSSHLSEQFPTPRLGSSLFMSPLKVIFAFYFIFQLKYQRSLLFYIFGIILQLECTQKSFRKQNSEK